MEKDFLFYYSINTSYLLERIEKQTELVISALNKFREISNDSEIQREAELSSQLLMQTRKTTDEYFKLFHRFDGVNAYGYLSNRAKDIEAEYNEIGKCRERLLFAYVDSVTRYRKQVKEATAVIKDSNDTSVVSKQIEMVSRLWELQYFVAKSTLDSVKNELIRLQWTDLGV